MLSQAERTLGTACGLRRGVTKVHVDKTGDDRIDAIRIRVLQKLFHFVAVTDCLKDIMTTGLIVAPAKQGWIKSWNT
jgi:hypothetical protein